MLMKPCEINQEIEKLLNQAETTRKEALSEEELFAQISALGLKRDELLQSVAGLALEARENVRSLKAKEKRLKERRLRMQRREERLIAFLGRACGGKQTDLGTATLYYRENSHVEITDAQNAASSLRGSGHEECFRMPEPQISRLAVGRLLDFGYKLSGVERVTEIRCYLK